MARGADTRQRELALDAPAPGSLQFDAELRACLAAAIAACPKPRERIAAEMESALGSDPDYPVSRALLDAWTAPSRITHRFPAIYMPSFCRVTGSLAPLDLVATKAGMSVIDPLDEATAEAVAALADFHRAKARWERVRRVIGRRR